MVEQLTDKALLEASDDEDSFRHLYERYWELLYKKAFHRLGNSADAQDIVQEVFITLWRNREHIEVQDTLSHYLFTALRYAIIKLIYRQAKKGILFPLSAEELPQTEISTEELLQYKELEDLISREVTALPERMQEVYRLSREQNLSIAEIASRLNLSEQTVKNTLSLAMKRLRERLVKYTSILSFLL